MPWSEDWRFDVVLGGTNTGLTLVREISVSCGEALSKKNFPLLSSSDQTILAKWP